ncbi:MAG: transglutaminase domain-containing protein [Ginsengibacter sp.]
MKTLIVLICVTYCAVTARGQGFGYIETDRIALNIPIEQTTTTLDIAQYIKRHFDSESKKIRAIYTWVTNNIKYDRNSIHLVILDEDREERVTYALERKKGVCENFAAIFNDLCIKTEIPSFIIQGYTKQSGYIDKSPHVWCTAFTDGQWFMYDPTWDAGFISNNQFISKVQTNYFKIAPANFIQNHLPFDPLFQLLDYPVIYKEFKTGNTRSVDKKNYFNYKDSIIKYAGSDSLTRYLSALQRISNNDWPYSLIDTRIKQIKLEIELIYQDSDMNLYNSVVDTYNQALGILNKFITYRNNQFLPLKNSNEIDSMFDLITQKIALANQKLYELNQSTATLALDTGDIAKKLSDLALKKKEQREYFDKHFKLSEL